MKGKRGGDIGCESEPNAQFFRLKPEQCQHQSVRVTPSILLVSAEKMSIQGIASAGVQFVTGDATKWNNPDQILAPVGETNLFPLAVGASILTNPQPVYLALRPFDGAAKPIGTPDLPRLSQAAVERRRAIAERVVVETPDTFIKAASAALNIAADAVLRTGKIRLLDLAKARAERFPAARRRFWICRSMPRRD